jgi:tetratricopeptide (TPR) repeat protein
MASIKIPILFSLLIRISASAYGAEIEMVDEVFTKLELQGVDTKSRLLYGYYFLSKHKRDLGPVKKALIQEGYSVVDLFEAEDGEIVLHLSKIETHDRNSLTITDNELRQLVTTFKNVDYCGWDVENVDPATPLVSDESFLNSIKGKKPSELFTIGVRLFDFGIYDKAALVFDICIARKINTYRSLIKSGVCCIEQKRYCEGIDRFKRVIKLNPRCYQAYYNIARISYKMEDYSQSRSYYSKCMELNPKDDRAIHGLALIQFVEHQYDESAKNCRKALRINPANEQALSLRNMIVEKDKERVLVLKGNEGRNGSDVEKATSGNNR